MSQKIKRDELGARERQIMDIIFSMGEASVSDVHQKLFDPPSYSSVRTMIRLLESKGLLKHRQQGTKYVYKAIQSKESASRGAIRHLVNTFFGGSAPDAVAALFDAEKLSSDDLARIEKLLNQARKEGR